MTQHDMEYYMNEKIELNSVIENNEVKNVIENEENKEIIDIKYSKDTYKIWNVPLIRPLVVKFLKERYPDSIIVHELNQIDITVFDNKLGEIIPVEIQKSQLSSQKLKRHFSNSEFEDKTRRQITGNVLNYLKCWLFFDSEYLRYLQSGNVGKNTSIDMTWIIKLMKENTLKVFAIKYDGTVKELTTKDFDFLKKISHTCNISYETDDMILNRNKLKIYINVIRGYKFTQEEIDNFYKELIANSTKHRKILFMQSNNERCKLYGYILHAIGNLPLSNMSLSMNIDKYDRHVKYDLVFLGILENVETYTKRNFVRLIDKFDICKYFPGYVRNKEQWNRYRNINIDSNTFEKIAVGNYRFEKSLMDY